MGPVDSNVIIIMWCANGFVACALSSLKLRRFINCHLHHNILLKNLYFSQFFSEKYAPPKAAYFIKSNFNYCLYFASVRSLVLKQMRRNRIVYSCVVTRMQYEIIVAYKDSYYIIRNCGGIQIFRNDRNKPLLYSRDIQSYHSIQNCLQVSHLKII
jgi:hypothetical protein